MNTKTPTALTLGALAALCITSASSIAANHRPLPSQNLATDQTPLTADQVHELMSRAIQNQHRDDDALDSFERIERHTTRGNQANAPATDEKLYRVVPTGSGTLKLLVRQNGSAVPTAVYERQLRDWVGVLEVAVHANDPREVAVLAKQQKRKKERARFVDTVLAAYQITWIGREVRDGHILEKLQLEPNPHYPPHGDATDWLTHARATVSVDSQALQMASIDATILRDISVGGGVLGKIYRGGHFHMEQAPVAPDIWEPTLYEYDISGRKFLFSFTLHETTASSHYAFLEGPEKALEVAQDNLAHCCNLAADP